MTVIQQQLYAALIKDSMILNNNNILQDFVNSPTAGSFWFNSLIGDLLSRGDAQSAMFALGMWEPDNKADSNLYSYYSWIAGMNLGFTLSAEDTAGIYALALSCPLTNGTVVYWARNLYNRITGQHQIFSNDCGTREEDARKAMKPVNKTISTGEIKVYPNPTTGVVNIQLPASGNWLITATDIDGRVVWQHECNGCSGIVKHSFEGGSKGLYFVKIINTVNGQEIVKKIILQ